MLIRIATTLAAIIVLASAIRGYGGTEPDANPTLIRISTITPSDSAVRGSTITLTTIGLENEPAGTSVVFWMTPAGANGKPSVNSLSGTDAAPIKLPISVQNSTCSVAIPASLRIGSYYVAISRQATEPPQNQMLLKVTRAPNSLLTLTSIAPVVAFPNSGLYDIVVLGSGFSEVAEDNVLVFDGQDEPDVAWNKDAAKRPRRILGVFHSTHKLEFRGIPAKFIGAQNVEIRVGDQYSGSPAAIILSRFDSKVPFIVGILIVAAFAGCVYGLVCKNVTKAKVDGRAHGVLATMLMDRETDTYSLAKFQFYCWTVAAVFGYVYLLAARSLIQGRFEFADVPENLPGLILASGATSAVARGISAARGPKGAGEIQPSLADLITVGGIVSVERFQFFIWTVLGVLAFLFLTVMQGASQIHELPKIPLGFLYLMGASSSGYLGGKLARKPGPIIDSIVAHAGSLTLTVVGHGLSRDATFKIDKYPVTTALVGPGILADDRRVADADAEVRAIRNDESVDNSGAFAAELRITMSTPAQTRWLNSNGLPAVYLDPPAAGQPATGQAADATSVSNINKRQLTIINPDGQMAVWTFEVKPA